MAAEHGSGGADESGMDGGVKVITPGIGFPTAAGCGDLTLCATEEDMAEEVEDVSGSEAAEGGEDKGEVGDRLIK